jgi:flagellar biosynthesis/type III secretory pathway protein FliH
VPIEEVAVAEPQPPLLAVPDEPAVVRAADDAVSATLVAIERLSAEVLAALRLEVADLATEIAQVLIERELEHRPELHLELAAAAVRALGETAPPVRARVSAETFEIVARSRGTGRIEVAGRSIQLEADPTVQGPGFHLDSGDASVDGTIETRLLRVRDRLRIACREAEEVP